MWRTKIRPVIIREEGNPEPQAAYVVFDDTAHLRIEVAASDDPAEMSFFDYNRNCFHDLPDLLDPKHGAYLYDMPMPGAEETSPYAYVCVVGGGSDEGEILYGAYLVAGEENMEALMADLLSWGYAVSWEYGDPAPVKTAPPQAYVLHIVDQDGAPVPGTTVNFCTDTTCSTLKADENGVITFDGTPDVYHVQLLKAPEGYSFDPDFDLYTGNAYSEWVLRIRRD